MEPNTWLWILAGFLAAIFLGTGLLKLTRSREELVAAGLTWAEDYSEPTLRALGWAEVLGAVGLVVPPLVGLGIVTPVAASCLAVLTGGAVVVHIRPGAPAGRAPHARAGRALRAAGCLPLRVPRLLIGR